MHQSSSEDMEDAELFKPEDDILELALWLPCEDKLKQ
jgi:hypothetical protein